MKSVIGTQFWIGFVLGVVIGPLLVFSFLKKVGTAPDIDLDKLELVDLEEKAFPLPDGPLVLNFWGTWCKPCIKEMPELDKLSAELASKQISVLAVSDEPVEMIQEFRDKNKFSVKMAKATFPLSKLKLEGVPTTYLIDRNGKVIYSRVGMLRPENPRFKKALEQLAR